MIVIRGAGPVGCATALALAGGARHRAILLAAQGAPESAPGQPIALSYASRLILERIGVWPRLAVTPIEAIAVSQAHGFGRVRLEAREAGVPALGYVIDYPSLAGALRAAVQEAGISTLEADPAPGGAPRCTVHAEGRAGEAEGRPYDQHAVVTVVQVEPRSGASAHERFTAEGPLALLPLHGGYGVVWSATPRRAEALARMPDADFLRELERAAGPGVGRFVAAAARKSVPLALRVRHRRAGPREVYVGNAAQALHPVAGQGLNLGLRDAWDLADLLTRSDDPGAAEVLARYAARRRLDRAATVAATDSLARLFVGSHALLGAARGIALSALDIVPPARRFFARRMIFGASALP